jgi:hypothetical protein
MSSYCAMTSIRIVPVSLSSGSGEIDVTQVLAVEGEPVFVEVGQQVAGVQGAGPGQVVGEGSESYSNIILLKKKLLVNSLGKWLRGYSARVLSGAAVLQPRPQGTLAEYPLAFPRQVKLGNSSAYLVLLPYSHFSYSVL